MNCTKYNNFQDDYLIKVIDKPAEFFMDMEESHFEEVFHCTFNGITSPKMTDLQKGTCRCKNINKGGN